MSELPTAAAYGRASTDKQDQSIEAQRALFLKYAALRDQDFHLDETACVLESDVSGSVPFADRPLAGALLRDCLAGKYQHLIVPKIDRLGRDAMDVQNTIAQLGKVGVVVHILDLGGSHFDTRSPISGMVIAVLAFAAQMHVETIRENVRTGLNHKRSKGEALGTVPYGWDATPTGEIRVNKGGKAIAIRRLSANPAEQRWILQMQAWRDAGTGYGKIAKELNRQGVPTKGGAGNVIQYQGQTRFSNGKWTAGKVHKLLHSKTVLAWLAGRASEQLAA